VNRRDF